jgi:hypothetical protein
MSYPYGQPPGNLPPGQPGYQAVPPGYPGYPAYPGYPPYPARRGAPGSVLTVAVLQYLGGLLSLLTGVLVGLLALGATRINVAPDVTSQLPPGLASSIAGLGLAVGGLVVLAGLVAIWFGRKLHRGRQWARILALVVSGLSIVGTLYNGLLGPGDVNVLTGLVVPVLYLVLLNTRAARSYFRTGTY